MANNSPIISIIVTTYNRKKYLTETIQSILDQTFIDFELIVVDNYSNYDFFQLISEFDDERIRAFQNRNNGKIGTNRNLGIKFAKGEYIAFCDDDDVWLPFKLEKQFEMFKKNCNAVIVYSDMSVMDENGQFLRFHAMNKMKKGMIFDELLSENFVGLSSLVVKKFALLESGGFSQHFYCQDYALILKLAAKYEFDFVDLPLVHYKEHKQNNTNNLELCYGEPIDYYKSLPLEYNFTNTQKSIWKKELSNLHVSYAFLAYLRKAYTKSNDIISAARNLGLKSWKITFLYQVNRAPFKFFFVYMLRSQLFARNTLWKLINKLTYQQRII